jgi:hypothetical protein
MAVSHLRNTPITGKSYTTSVDATLDHQPFRSCPCLQVSGLGVGGGQGGDQVGGLSAGLAAGGAGTGDPDGLLGVRERDSARGVQGDGFDGAGLGMPVTTLAGAVTDRDPRPGNSFELGEQGGLVALGLQEQMCPAPGLMETSKPGRRSSYAGTEEVSR